MNKDAIIASIAEKTGSTQKEAKAFLNAYIETVTEGLKKDGKVQLMGFGTFEIRERAAREAHNPHSGEKVFVEAKRVPAFVPGKALKEQF